MIIEGDYLDGVTSRRIPVRLEVIQHGEYAVRIHVGTYPDEGHQKIELKYRELKIESRIGNTPREIAFDEGQLFITDDNEAVDELIRMHGSARSPSFIHKLETNLPMIFMAVIASGLMVWATIFYGIPRSAEYIAYQLPSFSTEELGGGLAVLDETLFEPSELSAARQQEVRALFAPYLAAHQALKPKLEFRSGMKANALALPGGEIIFTDDFVRLAEDDRELLAVLFHELGHLKYRHITRRALQDSMVTILVIFIMGDIDTVDFLTGLPVLVLDLSYSREFEKEADDFALAQLHHFDIPVDYFATIMQRLEAYYVEQENAEGSTADKVEPAGGAGEKKSIGDFLSTHPSTADRVKLVEAFKRSRGIE
ncbi:MAG: M48 family metallopeptidase [Gammaproteobacteria bacterium]|nr:M48 family metallopeptidase [Gammaproteobacteria bacterium]